MNCNLSNNVVIHYSRLASFSNYEQLVNLFEPILGRAFVQGHDRLGKSVHTLGCLLSVPAMGASFFSVDFLKFFFHVIRVNREN